MIDISKKYKTKNGREVHIYATDAEGPHPVIGAILNSQSKQWKHERWDTNGKFNYGGYTNSHLDLVEVKPDKK
jgi:hypothetical protein